VVEGARLESVYRGNSIGGSNPPLSARPFVFNVIECLTIPNLSGEEVEATTFLVKSDDIRKGLWTSADYVGHTIKGLRDHEVAEEYIQHVIDIALETNEKAVPRAVEESRKIESLHHPAP
jgi:hypothetical protein